MVNTRWQRREVWVQFPISNQSLPLDGKDCLISGGQMFTYVQFPIADVRYFIAENTGRLTKPTWPTPAPYAHFVRSFGGIIPRRQGGISGWVGENEICNEKRVFKFTDGLGLLDEEANPGLLTAVESRQFYSDGIATGKYEVGFQCLPNPNSTLSAQTLCNYFHRISNSHIQFYAKPLADHPYSLINLGKPLARLYFYSSSQTKIYPQVQDKEWILHAPPVIFSEIAHREEVEIPADFRAVPLAAEIGIDLYHSWLNVGSRTVQIWVIKENARADFNKAYTLRLYLMRLNAEYEVLRIILQNIDAQKINIQQDGLVSERVQWYLNTITKRIFRTEQQVSSQFATDKISQIVCACMEYVNPGAESSFLTTLLKANIRPQVYKKMGDIYQTFYIGELTMTEYKLENVSGSNIIINSTLQNANVIIGSSNTISQALKLELEELIKQLDAELQKAPLEKKEEAEAVAEAAKDLVEKSAKTTPNKTSIQITAEGLKKAAENIAAVMPTVLTIAASIIKAVLKMTGVPVP